MTTYKPDYVDLKHTPAKDEIICEFRVEPAKGTSFLKACDNVALESSIGTWTEVSTVDPAMARRLRPHVYSMDAKKKTCRIAYPYDLFEEGSIPQLLSSIGGNIFGMKLLQNLRLEDIHLPERYVRKFKGPAFGIEGVRAKMKIKDRPFIGTIIKPKVGLPPVKYASIAYEVGVGGLDFIKDDENLTNQTYCPFDRRVELMLQAIDRAETRTGRKIGYSPNITAPLGEMVRRAEWAKDHGSKYIMIDILTVGWSALQHMRDLNLGMMIHAHRASHAVSTRNKRHGISMVVIAKLARLAGVDQLHIGTAQVGKMEGDAAETTEIEHEIEDSFVPERKGHVLEQSWGSIKPVLAVASGGLHPASVPKVVGIMGKNIVMTFGGGCHGHPGGSGKGATAIRQAVDATMKGIDLKEHAKKNRELAQALEKWGVR